MISLFTAFFSDAKLLAAEKQGRHRYFRLASPLVSRMLEGLMVVAQDGPARHHDHWRGGDALRTARTCYDHMAGRIVGFWVTDDDDDFLDHMAVLASCEPCELPQPVLLRLIALAGFGPETRVYQDVQGQAGRMLVYGTVRWRWFGGRGRRSPETRSRRMNLHRERAGETMDDEFWMPRMSFRVPVPEVEAAADLLALAAHSLLAGDAAGARSYLEQANMPVLRNYTRSIASQVTHDIHRLREVPGLAAVLPRAERGLRQPALGKALEIYQRDGFRCRYCSCRIVFPQVEAIMSTLLPGAVRWGNTDAKLNAAFYTLKGVLDHVDPHAHGGTSEAENLVVACQPCNYGKGSGFLQQYGLSDPRLRLPLVDDWDGLRRVLALRPAKARTTAAIARQAPAPPGRASIEDFTAVFSVADRGHLETLLQVLGSCGEIGVHWTVNRVLLAKLQVGGDALSPLGIEADATIQIPWWIGPYKDAFRRFAETLAAGMPEATVYETEKMWRVRCFGRMPQLAELMQDPQVVRDAFGALHRALRNL